MSEQKLRPFNLKEALAGKPVQTRDGRPVTQFHLFEVSDLFSLRAVVDGRVDSWLPGGRFNMQIERASPCDLFMAPVTKTYWVNVYRSTAGHLYTSTCWHSEESAVRKIDKSGSPEFIKTVSFTIDE